MPISPLCPPDAENYTGFYPQQQQASYANYPALNATIGGTQPFTIALWVRFFGFSPNPGSNVLSATDSQGQSYGFISTSGISGITTLLGHAGYATFQMNDPERKHWYYLVLTYDGNGNLSYYVDGGPFGTLQTQVGAIVNPAFMISANASGQNYPLGLNGQVRSLTVWNTCLTDADVMTSMWQLSPAVHTGNVLLYSDFTASPPNVTAGPTPNLVNSYYQLEAPCLVSSTTFSPGPATSIDPAGQGAFSAIIWLQGGDPWVPSVSTRLDPPADPPPTATGCLLSNRDQTDSGHFALLLNNGVLTAQFGAGAGSRIVTATGDPIPQGQWANVAITYDGTTCALYVNGSPVGSGAVTLATPTSAAAPSLFGRLNGGQLADIFNGTLQYASVWNRALSAAEVPTLQYEDPSNLTGCVANFACADSTPQDLVQLGDAVWDQNLLVPHDQGYFWIPLAVWPGVARSSAASERADLEIATLRSDFRNPRTFLGAGRGDDDGPEPFGPEHRALARAELIRFANSIPSGYARDRLLANFDEELERVFEQARRGELPDAGLEFEVRDGFTLVTDRETGETVRIEGELSPCAQWWLTFVYTLLNGFLTVLGIPTPVAKLTAFANQIINDPAVLAVLATIEGKVLTGGLALSMLRVIYDAGYIYSFAWLVVSSVGWWGVGKLVARIVTYFAPVPNPQQAIFIASCTVLVGQLVQQLLNYRTACPSGECEITASPVPASKDPN